MSNQQRNSPADALQPNAVFSLLADECRREVVEVLARRSSPVTLDELTTLVAGPDVVGEPGDGPAAIRKRVKTGLHHVHLPKLDAADVVDYDPDAKTVSPTRVERLREAAPDAFDEY